MRDIFTQDTPITDDPALYRATDRALIERNIGLAEALERCNARFHWLYAIGCVLLVVGIIGALVAVALLRALDTWIAPIALLAISDVLILVGSVLATVASKGRNKQAGAREPAEEIMLQQDDLLREINASLGVPVDLPIVFIRGGKAFVDQDGRIGYDPLYQREMAAFPYVKDDQLYLASLAGLYRFDRRDYRYTRKVQLPVKTHLVANYAVAFEIDGEEVGFYVDEADVAYLMKTWGLPIPDGASRDARMLSSEELLDETESNVEIDLPRTTVCLYYNENERKRRYVARNNRARRYEIKEQRYEFPHDMSDYTQEVLGGPDEAREWIRMDAEDNGN
ncbi:MAG: hypothetical protein J5755_06375, partial [Clostridia bacterium]|nr:hypothetical protein [Clostridia bacterium]